MLFLCFKLIGFFELVCTSTFMKLLQIGLWTCLFVMEGHSLQRQPICFWAQWFWVLFCAQKFLVWSCIPYTSYTSFEVVSGFIIPVQVLFLLRWLTQAVWVLLGVLECSSSQQHVMCNKEFSCENSNQGMNVILNSHLAKPESSTRTCVMSMFRAVACCCHWKNHVVL